MTEKILAPKNNKRYIAKKEPDKSISKEHDNTYVDDSSHSIKQQIIQICVTGTIFDFLFIKLRFLVG